MTGPWGFSQMASGTDEISTDGKSLVTAGSVNKGRELAASH